MRGAGLRIEVMRFSLLIVLTVALLSVAFRINAHHASTSSHPPLKPQVVPSSQGPGGQGQGTTPGAGPQPTASAVPHNVGGVPSTGSGGTDTAQTLPVTGWGATVRLGALAFLLIGGGTLAMRAGAPRRGARQLGQPTVQD